MVIGISVQFNAIIPGSYIQYIEHLLSTISAQSFGEYRENMSQPPTSKSTGLAEKLTPRTVRGAGTNAQGYLLKR